MGLSEHCAEAAAELACVGCRKMRCRRSSGTSAKCFDTETDNFMLPESHAAKIIIFSRPVECRQRILSSLSAGATEKSRTMEF